MKVLIFALLSFLMISNVQAEETSIVFLPCVAVDLENDPKAQFITGDMVKEYLDIIKSVNEKKVHPAHSLAIEQKEDGFWIVFLDEKRKVCFYEVFSRLDSIKITMKIIGHSLGRLERKFNEMNGHIQEYLEKSK